MKHRAYVDAAQREKRKRSYTRSEEEDREKERDTEIALKCHHITFCLRIARSVAEQQQAHADRRKHNDRLGEAKL
ncbi:hypothetical protein ALC62_06751 [Cyphomyrmex costatus]|uniref:Uncharacterized protein n=1 Tax=Cyphomyrmex costatus TaxID=456900 RepID=A0A195CNS8_9HYME|nr:hypothetical protein ALC62_06751 [Cyphomyrmex costatus]